MPGPRHGVRSWAEAAQGVCGRRTIRGQRFVLLNGAKAAVYRGGLFWFSPDPTAREREFEERLTPTGNPHGLPRVAERDFPVEADRIGAAWPGVVASGGPWAGGDVSGGLSVQPVLGARQPGGGWPGGRSEVSG